MSIGNNAKLVDAGRENQLLGTVLHEIGHHVVNTAKREPWADLPNLKDSTHLRREWLWICCTGWNYFHDVDIDPKDIVTASRACGEVRSKFVRALRSFNPYTPPPAFTIHTNECEHCGEAFEPKRSDAKYCSPKCRVYAHRAATA